MFLSPNTRCETFRWLLVASAALSSTGCLSLWGQPHSSLRPRTASTWESDSSVFRSQDERPVEAAAITIRAGKPSTGDVSRGPTPPSGHSVFPASSISDANTPQARLLQPQFGPVSQSNADKVPETQIPEIVIQPQQASSAASASAVDSRPTADLTDGQPSGHSIGFTADQIRRLMNEQSRNEMSEGRVLDDLQPQWQILNHRTSPAVAAKTQSDLAAAETAATNAQSVSTPTSTVPVQQAARSRETPVQPDVDPEAPAEEPSMLDRLRGFYGPSTPDQKSRQRWMKQFQKLPSPWNVFRDKEAPAAQPVEQSPLPPQTVELTDEGESRVAEGNPLLIQLIANLNDELQTWPRQPGGIPEDLAAFQRREQDLRLLYLIANQPGAAIAAIDTLPTGDQDFWQDVMLGLAQYRSNEPDVSREQRLSNTAGQFRTAVRRLAPMTMLRIRRIDICSQIHSFGRVETFPVNEFDPGDPILLYVELENFGSRLTTTGSYETSFNAQLKFYEDGNDEPIETVELTEITDQSTSERVDYYQSFELTIPSHLEAGGYRIGLSLRDRNTGKKADENVSFRVR